MVQTRIALDGNDLSLYPNAAAFAAGKETDYSEANMNWALNKTEFDIAVPDGIPPVSANTVT
jgi:hypothetical protein